MVFNYSNFNVVINSNIGAVSKLLPGYKKNILEVTETVVKSTFLRKSTFIEISLLFCDDKYIQNLNNIYRSKNKATNVLAFPQFCDINEKNIKKLEQDEVLAVGDIVISVDTLLKEAKDQNKSKMHHLLHLYVHGLLHLIGYDHILDEDAEKMEGLETKILKTKGIVPYSGDEYDTKIG